MTPTRRVAVSIVALATIVGAPDAGGQSASQPASGVRVATVDGKTRYTDPKGGYFSTPAQAADILARIKDDHDGAEPSPNSVAAMNLLRLSEITDRKVRRSEADLIFRALSSRLTQAGTSVPQLAVALSFDLATPRQIVIAGDPAAPDTRALLRLVNDRFIANKILLLADGGAGQAPLAQWLPFVSSMGRKNDLATIYICENYPCKLPTNDPAAVARQLDAADAGLLSATTK